MLRCQLADKCNTSPTGLVPRDHGCKAPEPSIPIIDHDRIENPRGAETLTPRRHVNRPGELLTPEPEPCWNLSRQLIRITGALGMKNPSRAAALMCAAAFVCANSGASPSLAGETVRGWPDYVAMGAIGGPNITPPTATSTGGNDDFGGRPVDVVFKYAGANGNGDPGIIDPPTNALRMTNDLTTLSTINSHPMRVAIVEYTAQMSGGATFTDFTNAPEPAPQQPTGSYIMARHFITLAADAIALNDKPVVYSSSNYYGTLILNPDLLGAIQQGGAISSVNNALPGNAVNGAVDQALCFLTVPRSYLNTSNPNGVTSAPYLNKTYTGTPVAILEALLADGYPVWSIEGQTDPYWNIAIDNLINGADSTYSQVGQWFNGCVTDPNYNEAAYSRPNFPAGFDGWVQANNWLIRTFSPIGNVTFGWQENMWAAGTGWWMHNDLTNTQIASVYSTPVAERAEHCRRRCARWVLRSRLLRVRPL
jgi:hypothetical protein